MPYKISKLNDEGGVQTTFYGKVTDEMLIESNKERLASTELIKSYRYFISDYTDVTDLSISNHTIRKIAQMAINASKLNENILVVGILPNDLEFGLGRMWQGYASDEETGWCTKGFRTSDAADKWLKTQLSKL